MRTQMPGGMRGVGAEVRGKAVIALDFGAKQVRISENSHFSQILAVWPFSGRNPLPCNPFQLKQTGGFLGFPEKFSGGGIWGEGWRNAKVYPSSAVAATEMEILNAKGKEES